MKQIVLCKPTLRAMPWPMISTIIHDLLVESLSWLENFHQTFPANQGRYTPTLSCKNLM